MERVLIWKIALRYLRGKGQANAVPVLSRISIGAIAVSGAAMIILLSVFNGFEVVVKDMYKAFYPDLKISVKRGKFFPASVIKLEDIQKIPGVLHVAPVIEDNALAGDEDAIGGSANHQKVVSVKGIDNNYFKVNKLGEYIDGVDTVSMSKFNTAILGIHIAHELGVDKNNDYSFVHLNYLNPEVTNPEDNPNAFLSLKLHPVGTFAVSDEFDDKYVLAPIELVQDLFDAPGQYSSIELSAEHDAIPAIQSRLRSMVGNGYSVETQYEQNKTIYIMMFVEKWAIYIILIFVMIIAMFNMVGALTMLVLEKQKDIAILRTMGATSSIIKRIFLLEGVLWSCSGGVAGLLVGCIICIIQQRFGIIKLASAFLVDAYPVKLALADILLVQTTIIFIGLAISWYPATRAAKTMETGLKSN